MRRIAIAVMATISGLALLFSYHTSTGSGSALVGAAGGSPGAGSTPPSDPAPSDPATPDPAAAEPDPTQAGSATSTPAPSPATRKATTAKASGTFQGDTVGTRWGPVQVVIVVKNGRVVSADVLQIPHDNPRDQEINQVAVPILNQEVTAGQTANIDGVSGATVTSDGYRQSLQSALDRAHL